MHYLLDVCCKAGGASAGYARAGFQIVGVDNEPQPRYPFEFYQADALQFIEDFGAGFDVIVGSPPCHDHTTLKSLSGKNGTGWLLGAVREAMIRSGKPWVLENVPGAPMRADLVLCGEQFGLRTVRHRWFESSIPLAGGTACKGKHRARTSTVKRRKCWEAGMNISVTGDVGTYVGSKAMGIDWMTGDELSQAIPPAYTEHIGRQLLEALRV